MPRKPNSTVFGITLTFLTAISAVSGAWAQTKGKIPASHVSIRFGLDARVPGDGEVAGCDRSSGGIDRLADLDGRVEPNKYL